MSDMKWIKIGFDMPHSVAKSITKEAQVLAFERGRYFNAWLEFDDWEEGWFWNDDQGSEPNPSHYTVLPAPPVNE